MPENLFSPKMKGKSINQLKDIINSKSYTQEAKEAAAWELEGRGKTDFETPDKVPIPKPSGEKIYKDFLKTVRQKNSIAWTPKYQELIRTELSDSLVFALTEEVFDKLEWEVGYYNGETIMAFRKNYWKEVMHKISVTPDSKGGISIISKSSKGVFDSGKNSQIVQLFIHVFNEVLKTKTPEELVKKEEEVQKIENWDDYDIPEKLPRPAPLKTPNPLAFMLIGLTATMVLGFLLACAMRLIHVIFLYEVLVGIGLSFILTKAIKWSNFVPLRSIHIFSIVAAILITTSAQYFTYLILLYENPTVTGFSFIDFINIRMEQGFTIRSMNLGWYGWVGILLLQPFLIAAVTIQRVLGHLLVYMAESVPEEVVQFASYHLVKGKTEQDVRTELSMKGWSDKTDQDHVFRAISSIQEFQEVRKELS